MTYRKSGTIDSINPVSCLSTGGQEIPIATPDIKYLPLWFVSSQKAKAPVLQAEAPFERIGSEPSPFMTMSQKVVLIVKVRQFLR
jgi:hypothetical protein